MSIWTESFDWDGSKLTIKKPNWSFSTTNYTWNAEETPTDKKLVVVGTYINSYLRTTISLQTLPYTATLNNATSLVFYLADTDTAVPSHGSLFFWDATERNLIKRGFAVTNPFNTYVYPTASCTLNTDGTMVENTYPMAWKRATLTGMTITPTGSRVYGFGPTVGPTISAAATPVPDKKVTLVYNNTSTPIVTNT